MVDRLRLITVPEFLRFALAMAVVAALLLPARSEAASEAQLDRPEVSPFELAAPEPFPQELVVHSQPVAPPQALDVPGLELAIHASSDAADPTSLDIPSGASEDAARAANLAAWRGRFCLSPTCTRTPAARIADTLAFGGAILGVAWLSRRRALKRG
jgi:hypothetical protein